MWAESQVSATEAPWTSARCTSEILTRQGRTNFEGKGYLSLGTDPGTYLCTTAVLHLLCGRQITCDTLNLAQYFWK